MFQVNHLRSLSYGCIILINMEIAMTHTLKVFSYEICFVQNELKVTGYEV